MDNHSSLLQTLVNYGCKSFITLGSIGNGTEQLSSITFWRNKLEPFNPSIMFEAEKDHFKPSVTFVDYESCQHNMTYKCLSNLKVTNRHKTLFLYLCKDNKKIFYNIGPKCQYSLATTLLKHPETSVFC